MPSAQSSSQNQTFVSTSKNLLKNRNRTFPIVRYFRWKLELSQIFFEWLHPKVAHRGAYTKSKIQSLQKSNLFFQFQKLLKSAFSLSSKIKLLNIFSAIFVFAHMHETSLVFFNYLVFCSSYIWRDIRVQKAHLKT